MAVKVNFIELRKQFSKKEAQVLAPKMKTVLNEQFEKQKREFFKEFDSNDVNKELDNGARANGKIISTEKGGNLYSALGFVDGVEPVTELRNILENNITKGRVTKELKNNGNIIYNLEARVPTISDLKKKTQLLTWTSRSFIDLIENGISNFRRYLFDKSGRLQKYSRSGTAIQVKKEVRDTEFKGVSYITDMINRFKSNLRNFNKK